MNSSATTGRQEVSAEECLLGSTRSLVALVAVTMAGCLPSGSPPIGQHLLSDRTLSGVHFSPSEIDGVPSRLLATGPAQAAPYYSEAYTVADLYEIPTDTGSEAAPGFAGPKLLAEKCLVPQDDASDWAVQTDIRGRPIVVRYIEAIGNLDSRFDVFRVDLATGKQDSLGDADYNPRTPPFVLSPGRTRALVGPFPNDVVELDGGYTWLGYSVSDAAFVGEDAYYDGSQLADSGTPDLWRVVPDGQPELLDHNTRLFTTFATDQGPRLILARDLAPADASLPDYRYLFFDPATLQESPFSSEAVPDYLWDPSAVLASPDGHWLAFLSAITTTADTLTLFNWVTFELQQIDASDSSAWEWRPGHEELWLTINDGTLRIWKPETGVTPMPVAPVQNARAPNGTLSIFTSDGNYWFSMRPGQESSGEQALYVGSADDPAGTAYQVTPAGAQIYSHWELADGRILAGAWTTSDYRKDYYLVDPSTGASQGFAVNGLLVALGHTRVLAHVNWEAGLGTGDLCLIDLATGTQTLLAQDVYAAAVDPGVHADVPAGTDALATGTRIAFLVRNRIDSPYDGVWIAELP
jgi:hypothetical protein